MDLSFCSPLPSRPIRSSTLVPETPTTIDFLELEDSDLSSYSPTRQFEPSIFIPEAPPIEVNQSDCHFTEDEMRRFARCFEEKYDVDNHRYKLWLSIYGNKPSEELISSNPSSQEVGAHYYEQSSCSTHASPEHVSVLNHTSVMSKVIRQQVKIIKFPEKRPKTSARVLTKKKHLTCLLNKEEEKKIKKK